MNTICKRAFPAAIVAAALICETPSGWSMDGAILVVSSADGPMPAPIVEGKIRRALGNANVPFSSSQLSNLTEQVTRAIKKPGGKFNETICVSGESPCITLVRE